MRVLILRPEPGAGRTAARVAALGHQPVVAPLFDILPVAWSPPPVGMFDAIAMTSANAARHGGAALRELTHLPLFAVGQATVAAARASGFTDVTAGSGDAHDLAALIPAGLRVVHLCGRARRALPVDGVTELVVYAAVPHAVDHATVANADVALVHAPSAGRGFAALMRGEHRAAMHLIAISARAAAACGRGWRAVDVASRPHEEAMLELLGGLCEKQE